MDHIKKDDRFSHISTDPKFRKLAKKHRKVKIDKRFHGMFSDKSFKVTYTVDKRGRPVKTSSNDHLKKLYDLDSNEEDSEEDGDESIDEKEDNVIGLFSNQCNKASKTKLIYSLITRKKIKIKKDSNKEKKGYF